MSKPNNYLASTTKIVYSKRKLASCATTLNISQHTHRNLAEGCAYTSLHVQCFCNNHESLVGMKKGNNRGTLSVRIIYPFSPISR